MYLEQERGQKNKQFYRESIEEGNDVKARQVHCQHLSSYCYTTTSTMQWKKHHDLPTRCMRAHSLQHCLLYIYTRCLKITEKSHSILRAKRATFKFWVQILNQKYQKWSIWQVFENATFGRFSNTVYTKSLLCKANIVVCRVALRLLTFTSWLEAWGEEDLFPTTALRPRGFSRFLNSKKSIFTACHDV